MIILVSCNEGILTLRWSGIKKRAAEGAIHDKIGEVFPKVVSIVEKSIKWKSNILNFMSLFDIT